MDRNKQIIRVSVIGILVNLLLVAAKAAVGFVTGSVAVVMDAVNNLSDALSSVITIIGTKIAGKRPDKQHPFGHGRVEYITSMLIAALVLFAGVAAARESIEKIIHPVTANYTTVSLVIIAMGVLTKFFLGRYVSARGRKLNSQSLIASGADASFDAVLSLSTLAAALVSVFLHVSIEGILGVIIAVVIVKAGLEILGESVSSLIGARVDSTLSERIKEIAAEEPEVLGVFDLILNRYGPEMMIGSLHVEVEDRMTAREIHQLTRRIQEKVFAELGIILTVGIYASNTDDPEGEAARRAVSLILEDYPQVLQMHGFFMAPAQQRISFDVVMDFAEEEPDQVCGAIREKVQEKYPGYRVDIVIDSDFSD